MNQDPQGPGVLGGQVCWSEKAKSDPVPNSERGNDQQYILYLQYN